MWFKSWKFWGVCLVIAGLLSLLGFGFTTDPKQVPSPLIGKPAADFSVTSLAEGKALSLKALRGQPVVLNFWASWCLECQEEARVLETFYQQYEVQAQQVRVIGIAIQDTPERAAAFARQFGKTYFLALDDASGKIALDYGIYGVPETFFIDPQGVIRFKQVGGVTPELMAEKLKQLLQPSNTNG